MKMFPCRPCYKYNIHVSLRQTEGRLLILACRNKVITAGKPSTYKYEKSITLGYAWAHAYVNQCLLIKYHRCLQSLHFVNYTDFNFEKKF